MNLSTRGFWNGRIVLFVAALMLTSMVVSASPITGTFGFDGPGVLAFSNTGDFIDFCSSVTGTTCNNDGSGTGSFTVTGAGTQSFSVLTSSTKGSIDDMSDVHAAGYTYFPVGVAVSIDDIIALAGFSTWDFQANMLPLASCVSTSTQQCLGPFQLNQNNRNVAVEMNIYGTLINTTDGSKSYTDLAITGNYLNTTIAAVEAGAESSTGIFSNNWSASVTAVTPEPGTGPLMLLAGAGLLLLSRIRRGRKS